MHLYLCVSRVLVRQPGPSFPSRPPPPRASRTRHVVRPRTEDGTKPVLRRPCPAQAVCRVLSTTVLGTSCTLAPLILITVLRGLHYSVSDECQERLISGDKGHCHGQLAPKDVTI